MTEEEMRAAMEEAQAAETDEALPTGRCKINAGGVTNCTSGMTQRSCYQVAANVGGVADWTEGARCP